MSIIVPSEPTIRIATKKGFLRCINRRRPPTKWSGKGSRSERKLLARDFVNLQALLKSEAMGTLTKAYKEVLENQLDAFEENAKTIARRTRIGKRAVGDDEWSPEEIALALILMEDAIRFAFSNPAQIRSAARPIYQSLIDRSYSRSRFLLGEANGLGNPSLASRNEKMLKNLSLLQQSTQRMAEYRIQKAFERADLFRLGVSWTDAIAAMRQTIKERILSPSRLTTIARTEGGRSVDEGIKETFKKSKIVSTASVVGCKAVEPNIPTYRGEPTCNIEEVPYYDVDAVEFHINHTGAWIASGFGD